MLRYLTAGESHGEYLAGILEGFPAGVRMPQAYIKAQLNRRRTAPGRSARQALEKDDFRIISGLEKETTTGAPIAVLIRNASRAVPPPSSLPRPGHADLPGMLKYNTLNAALIRERASARETAMRTALGSFAMRLNELLGIEVNSRVTNLGGLCSLTAGSAAAELLRAKRAGDTLGGEFEVSFDNVPAGLGSCAHPDRRLGARLGAALLSVNGVKGFEIGGGFSLAAMGGKEAAQDPQLSGGLDGGMTNGGALLLRCAVKPVPGLRAGTPSTDLRTFRKKLSVSLTSDTTAVFAAAVVAEHAASLELAAAVLEKFGGDSLCELLPRVEEWRKRTKKAIARL
ncbi:MAG: chorismate synthase [Elusimicrobiales bacterium]|nr:chorismate synthase [Elusimicrobiales bacterium]